MSRGITEGFKTKKKQKKKAENYISVVLVYPIPNAKNYRLSNQLNWSQVRVFHSPR